MIRFRHILLIVVVIVAAVALTRTRPDMYPARPATTPTVTATVTAPTDPAADALARRFIDTWREVPLEGPHEWAGANAWLQRLATVATPALVSGLAATDPAHIPTGTATAVETPPGAAVVTFSDGRRLILTVTGGLVSAVNKG